MFFCNITRIQTLFVYLIVFTDWKPSVDALHCSHNENTEKDMHVIARKIFNDAINKYPNDAGAIDDLYKILNSGKFRTPSELKNVIPSLDNFKYKDKWWVIDIGGNNLRMLAFIEFRHERVYVKHIVNHSDYDKLTSKYKSKRS